MIGIATFRIGLAPLSITNTSLVASMSTVIRRDADMMLWALSVSVEIPSDSKKLKAWNTCEVKGMDTVYVYAS